LLRIHDSRFLKLTFGSVALPAGLVLNLGIFLAALGVVLVLLIVLAVLYRHPTRPCPKCGSRVRIDHRMCNRCGYRITIIHFR
jgi:hypothetical protein